MHIHLIDLYLCHISRGLDIYSGPCCRRPALEFQRLADCHESRPVLLFNWQIINGAKKKRKLQTLDWPMRFNAEMN